MNLLEYLEITQKDDDFYDTTYDNSITIVYDGLTDGDTYSIFVRKLCSKAKMGVDGAVAWSRLIDDNIEAFKAFDDCDTYEWINKLHAYCSGEGTEEEYQELINILDGCKEGQRMRYEDIKGINEFAKTCLFNAKEGKEVTNKVNQLLEESKDTYEFINKVLNYDGLKMTHCYAMLSKSTAGHFRRLKDMLGDKVFTTISDKGALKIGSGNFTILVPNMNGDGTTRVAIIDDDSIVFNSDMLDYFTLVEGDIDIYSYDCDTKVIKTICGKYMVYHYDSFVVFKKVGIAC